MALQKILTDIDVDGTITSDSFIKDGGTPSQFLKADGSVDLSDYLLNTTDTFSGVLTVTSDIVADTDIYSNGDTLKLLAGGIGGTSIQINDTASVVAVTADIEADAFIKNSGTSSQFLKADGSTDSNTYLTSSSTQSKYLRSDADDTSSGTVTATNFILSSDKRLKNNIKEVSSNHIDVNWKTFEMNSKEGQSRYGVIAQELEEVHPEFVRTDDEGMKSVAYIDLLIAKIAELEARLDKANI